MHKFFGCVKELIKENKFLVIALIFLSIVLQTIAYQSYQADYRCIFVAIKSFLSGYDPYLNNAVHGASYADFNYSGFYSRLGYPPLSFLLFIPFGLFNSYAVSKELLTGFSCITLIGLILYLKRKHNISDMWCLLAFASLPVITCIERGQVWILVILFMVLAYDFRDKFWSGILIAISFHLRVIPILVLIYFLIRKQYKIFFSSIFFSIIIFLISLLFVDLPHYMEFFRVNQTGCHPILIDLAKYKISNLPITTGHYIITNEGHFFYNQFGFFLNPAINFLNIFFKNPIFIYLTSIIAMITYSISIRKRPESPIYYYVFILLTLSFNYISVIYQMVYYLPFYFAALKKYQDNLFLVILLTFPLFTPTFMRQGAIDCMGGISPCYIFALLIAFYILSKESCKKEPLLDKEQ